MVPNINATSLKVAHLMIIQSNSPCSHQVDFALRGLIILIYLFTNYKKPLVSIPSQTNPINTCILQFFSKCFIFILSFTPRFLKWYLPFRISDLTPLSISDLRTFHISWFDHTNNFLWKLQSMMLLNKTFVLSSFHFLHGPNLSLF
jgi:hypothetical protein